MTGALDTELRAAAIDLLAEYGKAVTWVSVTETYSEDTGSTTATRASYSVVASPPEPYSSRLVDGSTILATDFRVTIAARDLTFEPSIGDELIVDAITFRVLNVTRVYSGNLVATWEAQCRR